MKSYLTTTTLRVSFASGALLYLVPLLFAGANLLAAPEYESDPPAGTYIEFETQDVGVESAIETVRVYNTGNDDLTLDCTITGTGSDSFKLGECAPTLAGTEEIDVAVSCQAQDVGNFTAQLEITTNDVDEPTVAYGLTCVGARLDGLVKVTFKPDETDETGIMEHVGTVKHSEDMEEGRRTVRNTSCVDCDQIRPHILMTLGGNGKQCSKYADRESGWQGCDLTFGAPYLISSRKEEAPFNDPCDIDTKAGDCDRSYTYQTKDTLNFKDFDTTAGTLSNSSLRLIKHEPARNVKWSISGWGNPYLVLKTRVDVTHDVNLDQKAEEKCIYKSDDRRDVCGLGNYRISNVQSKTFPNTGDKFNTKMVKYLNPPTGADRCSKNKDTAKVSCNNTWKWGEGLPQDGGPQEIDLKATYHGVTKYKNAYYNGYPVYIGSPRDNRIKQVPVNGTEKDQIVKYGPTVTITTNTHVVRYGHKGTDQPLGACFIDCERTYDWPNYPGAWTRGPGCGFVIGMEKCAWNYDVKTTTKTDLQLSYTYRRVNLECTGDCEKLETLWNDPCTPYEDNGCTWEKVSAASADVAPSGDSRSAGQGVSGFLFDVPSALVESNSLEIKSEPVIVLNARFVRVAVLSNVLFDTANVDPDSTVFGPALARAVGHEEWDVNSDGMRDLVLDFYLADTGINCQTLTGSLMGQTVNGNYFASRGAISVIMNPGERKGGKQGSEKGGKGGWVEDKSFCRDN